MDSTRIALIVVMLAAPLGAQSPGSGADANTPYRQASLPIDERVRDLIGRMTVEEKARQLDMYAGIPGLVDKSMDKTHAAPDARFRPDSAAKLFGTLGAGSIHDLYPRAELANDIQRWVIGHSRLGIPAIFIEEGLHGYSDGTVFPTPLNLAATWNPDLARRTGAAIAAEMRAAGVHMVLGPVLDVAREPRWGRVEEDFGEDPFLTGQLGLAYVEGVQGDSLASDHNVIAEPKHYVGHGSPESGLNTSPVHAGEREVRTIMLKSFEPAIREGHAMGVMAAYHEIDGIPVADDPVLLKDVLRGEWGFRGVLVKFKLEVGVSDERLLEIAERSRRQSAADLMAANTLEGAGAWAFLGPVGGQYQRVSRRELAARLLGEVERLHEERTRG